MRKVPVFPTIGQSYRFVLVNIVRIFAVCLVPIGAFATFFYFFNNWSLGERIKALNTSNGSDQVPEVSISDYVVARLLSTWPTLLEALAVSIAAVCLHRMVLFGERLPMPRASRTEWLFVGLSIAAVLGSIALVAGRLSLVLVMPPGGIPPIFVLVIPLIYFAVFVVGLRFTQMFPIVVAEGRISFGRSWSLTRHNWWRIFWITFLGAIPISVAAIVVVWLSGSFVSNSELDSLSQGRAVFVAILERQRQMLLPMALVNFVFYAVSTAVGVALLSFTYKKLNGLEYDAVLAKGT